MMVQSDGIAKRVTKLMEIETDGEMRKTDGKMEDAVMMAGMAAAVGRRKEGGRRLALRATVKCYKGGSVLGFSPPSPWPWQRASPVGEAPGSRAPFTSHMLLARPPNPETVSIPQWLQTKEASGRECVLYTLSPCLFSFVYFQRLGY